MTVCHFHKLPNELLVQVFADIADLQAAPASTANFMLEPSAGLAKASRTPLKDLSLVCRRWRIVMLPILFRYACVALDTTSLWLRLCIGLSKNIKAHCQKTPRSLSLVKKIDDLAEASVLDKSAAGAEDRALGFEYSSEELQAYPEEYYHWIPSCKGEASRFLEFVERHDLTSVVKGLVVYAHKEIAEDRSNFEQTILYNEVKKLWRQIFRTIELEQLIVAAPPSTMAVLTGSQDDPFDSWLFQMKYHYLRFSRNSTIRSASKPNNSSPSSSPDGCSRETFIYNIRPWTHMAYNEGTSLRAYGHYEYQWKQPPRVLPNLIEWLARERTSPRTPKLETVEYISSFPYATHMRHFVLGVASIPSLRELRVKLANPDLLEDKKLVGKAEPRDVYHEWESCYKLLSHHFLAVAGENAVLTTLDTKHATLKKQVLDCIESRGIVPLSSRVRREEDEKDGIVRWRIAEARQ